MTVAQKAPTHPYLLTNQLTPLARANLVYEEVPLKGTTQHDVNSLVKQVYDIEKEYWLLGVAAAFAPLGRLEFVYLPRNQQRSMLAFDANGKLIRHVIDASFIYGSLFVPEFLDKMNVSKELFQTIYDTVHQNTTAPIILYRPYPLAANTPDNWAWYMPE